jgi:hypothetical protein
MPRIGSYEPQVSPSGAGLGPGPIRGSDATAGGVRAFARGLDQVQVAIEEAREQDAASWSAQTLSTAQSDWTQTLEQRKASAPLDAANFTPDLLRDFDEYSAKTVGQAPTKRTRQFLEERFTVLRGDLATRAIAFEAASRTASVTLTAKKSIDSARSELQVQPDVFSDRLAERAALIDSMRLPAATKQELTDYAVSAMSRDAALGLIQRDPRETLKLLNTQPGKTGVAAIEALTADDRIQLRNAAEAEVRRLDAEDKTRLTEARQAMDDQLRDIAVAAQGGIPVTTIPSLANLKALFGEREGSQRYEGAQRAAKLSNTVAGMHTLSTPELISQASSFVPTQVEGAAEQARLAAFVAGRTEAIVRQRREDPAGYLVQHSPAARDAWGQFSQAEGDDQEEATQAYLRTVRAERERLGLPGNDVLPNSYAQGIADQINGAVSGEQLANTLEAEGARWGLAWPQVYGQLAPKLSDTALVVGSGIPRAAATALASMSQMKDSELKALLPTSTKWEDVQASVHDQTQDFQRSFPSEGARTFNAFNEAATRLTVRYMQQGASKGDAAAKAYRDLIGSQYQMIEYRGATIRVPTTIDGDSIENGARSSIERFAPASNAIAVPPGSPLTPEEYAGQFGAYVRQYGYWLTRPDGKGVRLYVDGGPVVENGAPLERTWEELQGLHAELEAKRIEAQRAEARRRQELR